MLYYIVVSLYSLVMAALSKRGDRFPCGLCRWLRRLCCISSILCWLTCSRFVSRYLLDGGMKVVFSEVFFCTSC